MTYHRTRDRMRRRLATQKAAEESKPVNERVEQEQRNQRHRDEAHKELVDRAFGTLWNPFKGAW